MMWQVWTAFGIMLGYISAAVFQSVLDGGNPDKCGPKQVSETLLSLRCVSNTYLVDREVLPTNQV